MASVAPFRPAALRKAIDGCHEVQGYARPLIFQVKYKEGAKVEHTLSPLMNATLGKPGCVELQAELERIYDLIFQLKYMCVAPMLRTMEDIESNSSVCLSSSTEADGERDPALQPTLKEMVIFQADDPSVSENNDGASVEPFKGDSEDDGLASLDGEQDAKY